MLGCFGQRKKKGAGKGSKPIDKNQSGGAAAAAATPSPNEAKNEHRLPKPTVQPPQQQQQPEPHSAQDPSQTELPEEEVTETVTVTRAQSLHQQAPDSQQQRQQPTVRKAATLGRYDFLKKYDSASSSDRWSALKQQYLSPKDKVDGHNESDATDSAGEFSPAARRPPLLSPLDLKPPPKSPLPSSIGNGGGFAKSLPRQFSPPSTVVSPVKFSQWFYERKTKENEAHKECHDREERMQLIIEGPSQDQVEEAAVKIQAGYKGYRARKQFKESRREEQRKAAEAAAAVEETDRAAEAETDQLDRDAAAAQEMSEAVTAEADQSPEVKPDDSQSGQSPISDDQKSAIAAVKIQAGFRGMQARKEVAAMRKHHGGNETEASDAAADAPGNSEGDAAVVDHQ